MANVYGWGENKGRTEEIIGTRFAQGGDRREKTVLATKVYGSMYRDADTWPNYDRLSALNIRQAVEALIQQGWILYSGSFNFPGYKIAEANETAARRGMVPYGHRCRRTSTCSTSTAWSRAGRRRPGC